VGEAARPNEDAELAREAVHEGSATAAMVDYLCKALVGLSKMGRT